MTETKNPLVKISDALKIELRKVKGSLWRKIVLGVVGVFLTILAFVGVVALIKKKPPIQAAKDEIKVMNHQIAKVELDAKIEVAKAQGAEEQVIVKLEEIKKIDNKQERLDELAKLL